MEERKPMTRFDVRLLSGGYILPIIGIAAWVVGVLAPSLAWLTGTPIYDRNMGQAESVLSLPVVLFGEASAIVGTILILVGSAIRRAYQMASEAGSNDG